MTSLLEVDDDAGWTDVDWIHVAQEEGPVADCCEYGNEPLCSITCWKFPEEANSPQDVMKGLNV
jgi:hypothetical protein